MRINLSSVDRILRIVVGLIALSLMLLADDGAPWFALIGSAPILTALLGWCPLYALTGMTSCPTRESA